MARCLQVSELDADRIALELSALQHEGRGGAGGGGGGVAAVVAVKDTQSPLSLYALRMARHHGAATALLMDGIVECRNSLANPWVEQDFLRPAPVDLVLAAGRADRDRLAGWGNVAAATGLPRLDSAVARARSRSGLGVRGPRIAASPDAPVLVATARRCAFSDEEFETLLRSMLVLKAELESSRGPAGMRWRVTEGLDALLGVSNDPRSLQECLEETAARGGAVLTTPSTLMIESMLAGCTTGFIHPFGGELWQESPWIWRGADCERAESLQVMLRSMLAPEPVLIERQRAILAEMLEGTEGIGAETDRTHAPPSAATRVVQALVNLAAEHGRAADTSDGLKTGGAAGAIVPGRARALHAVARLPAEIRRGDRDERVRIVNMVSVDGSPVGGVMSWAFRLARELPRQRPDLDVRTLAVVSSPEALWGRGFDINPNGTTSVCTLDPMMDAHERVELLACAIERVADDAGAVGGGGGTVILPNFSDVCYMSALLARARLNNRAVINGRGNAGARLVTVAHTDTDYYRELARHYGAFDAAVGVSAACARWLRQRPGQPSDDRPVYEIPCGVEVDPSPRTRAPLAAGGDGTPPLIMGYIGRIVEEQKRVGLLLDLVRELDRQDMDTCGEPGRRYELHIVGDGPDLSSFVRRAAALQRELGQGRVIIHGRKSLSWVEAFTRALDVSLLVSSYEGTSVTMLEAMARGVVPCVTNVGSGVSEWLRDGENAVVVGVDRVPEMAPRLAQLAREPGLIKRLGDAAWRTVRGTADAPTSANIEHTARAYAALFDEVLARPAESGVRAGMADRALVPMDPWRWSKTWCDDPQGARRWCERSLGELGYAPILEWGSDSTAYADGLTNRPAVVIDTARGEPLTSQQLEAVRRQGLGVVVTPMLTQDGLAGLVLARVREEIAALAARADSHLARRSGARPRIAVYGTGHHTRRCRALFEQASRLFGFDPFVGFIDDAAPRRVGRPEAGDDTDAGQDQPTCFGRPVVPVGDAMEVLAPDLVLLSSDAFEAHLWARTADLRRAGVGVIALYGPHAQAEPAPAPSHALDPAHPPSVQLATPSRRIPCPNPQP